MVLPVHPPANTAAYLLRAGIALGLLWCPSGSMATAAQTRLASPPPVAPVAKALTVNKVPDRFTTPPLVAVGFGLLPAVYTTRPLVAIGSGFLPASFTTPSLVARGFGMLPAQLTTRPLVVTLPATKELKPPAKVVAPPVKLAPIPTPQPRTPP